MSGKEIPALPGTSAVRLTATVTATDGCRLGTSAGNGRALASGSGSVTVDARRTVDSTRSAFGGPRTWPCARRRALHDRHRRPAQPAGQVPPQCPPGRAIACCTSTRARGSRSCGARCSQRAGDFTAGRFRACLTRRHTVRSSRTRLRPRPWPASKGRGAMRPILRSTRTTSRPPTYTPLALRSRPQWRPWPCTTPRRSTQ